MAASTPSSSRTVRSLIVVLGDQLDDASAAFADVDPREALVWMAEVAHESTKVWSSRPRIAVFLSAMRHFRDRLRTQGWRVLYRELTNKGAQWQDRPRGIHAWPEPTEERLGSHLAATLAALKPERVIWVEPGEWSVREELLSVVRAAGIPFEVRADSHFLCSAAEFQRHAEGRKQLRLEFFYRELRQKTGILMESGQPAGGQWNFDADNREFFGREGPVFHAPPRAFPPDSVTRQVIEVVNARFATHPGTLTAFDWPVTREEALLALADFIEHRLAEFGRWQDAMWTGEPWLFHSRLSAALNLKLLNPREVIAAAELAWKQNRAPLASVEGFIRQILGWREYVRGIYWRFMPDYVERNQLGAEHPLPGFYWNADTEYHCLRQTLTQTLQFGYAHHIQRLMITGLFSLLLGVHPKRVHEWYLAVYVDAVEWVELPNTLGMSQYADGGVMASKPYIASGKYIERMSNYCAGCRFDPAQSTGPNACPFTTLYWDFLMRHETTLAKNPRMGMQVRNLKRLSPPQRDAIQRQATQVRLQCAA